MFGKFLHILWVRKHNLQFLYIRIVDKQSVDNVDNVYFSMNFDKKLNIKWNISIAMGWDKKQIPSEAKNSVYLTNCI